MDKSKRHFLSLLSATTCALVAGTLSFEDIANAALPPEERLQKKLEAKRAEIPAAYSLAKKKGFIKAFQAAAPVTGLSVAEQCAFMFIETGFGEDGKNLAQIDDETFRDICKTLPPAYRDEIKRWEQTNGLAGQLRQDPFAASLLVRHGLDMRFDYIVDRAWGVGAPDPSLLSPTFLRWPMHNLGQGNVAKLVLKPNAPARNLVPISLLVSHDLPTTLTGRQTLDHSFNYFDGIVALFRDAIAKAKLEVNDKHGVEAKHGAQATPKNLFESKPKPRADGASLTRRAFLSLGKG